MSAPTVGQRVRLTGEMPGEAKYQPLPVGSTGVVVRGANAVGQVWVRWDPPNENRRLMLLTTDPFEVVEEAHVCDDHAVPYVSDGTLGHGWECGICGAFLQAG